jgi:hypothetical protein
VLVLGEAALDKLGDEQAAASVLRLPVLVERDEPASAAILVLGRPALRITADAVRVEGADAAEVLSAGRAKVQAPAPSSAATSLCHP